MSDEKSNNSSVRNDLEQLKLDGREAPLSSFADVPGIELLTVTTTKCVVTAHADEEVAWLKEQVAEFLTLLNEQLLNR